MWNAGVGPTKDAYTIADNPQYVLKFGPGNGSVWVLLTRHITNIDDFRNNREYISIVAYENGGRKVYYPCERTSNYNAQQAYLINKKFFQMTLNHFTKGSESTVHITSARFDKIQIEENRKLISC